LSNIDLEKLLVDFKQQGYVVIENYFNTTLIKDLIDFGYQLIDGNYETFIAPDKIKKPYNLKSTEPIQLCNVWKSNKTFAKIILSEEIGKIASFLIQWDGVRLNQDSLFLVKPGSGGVSMHQDEVYQDWNTPGNLITATIVLTDIGESKGGIEFIPGSHKWGKKSEPLENFFTGQFYKKSVKPYTGSNDGESLVVSAKSGALVFHHGLLWHGSNINMSEYDRMSIACHYMPHDSQFHHSINNPVLSHYKIHGTLEMKESFFPILWSQSNKRSEFLN
tara:strand:+ start:8913 stop:9740 length:828 start_codon:yes stop_codon:yes gene_type:complete